MFSYSKKNPRAFLGSIMVTITTTLAAAGSVYILVALIAIKYYSSAY